MGAIINKNFKLQSGRSMIEMLGVLGIIGVLSVGGIAGYSNAMDKYKINKISENMLTIITNVRNMKMRMGGTSYTDSMFTYKVLKKLKIVPDEMIKYNNSGEPVSLYGEYGNSVYMYQVNNTGFLIDYVFIPRETCVNLVTRDWGDNLIVAAGSKLNSKDDKKDNTGAKAMVGNNKLLARGECNGSGSGKNAYYYCRGVAMSPSMAAKACDCGSEAECSFTIWSLK